MSRGPGGLSWSPDANASRWTPLFAFAAGPLASGRRSRRDVWKDSAEEKPPSAAPPSAAKRDGSDSRVASGSAQWRRWGEVTGTGDSAPREAPPTGEKRH